jgi:DNA-binding PadR family transcriptional regulator
MATQTIGDMTEPRYWEMLIKKSVSRYLLLDMLGRRPMYGYEVAKEIETCCDGWCKPTPGMIYPAIKDMVADGYIECTEDTIGGRVRKICHLTDKGRQALLAAAEVWGSVLTESVREVTTGTISDQAGCDAVERCSQVESLS